MTIDLPAPIAAYFVADREADPSAISRHFAQDAIVKDEGHTYKGREAIRRWKAASSKQYSYRAEPIALTDEAGRSIVTAHLTGNFPGSPVDLRYRFALDGGLIAEMEIGA